MSRADHARELTARAEADAQRKRDEQAALNKLRTDEFEAKGRRRGQESYRRALEEIDKYAACRAVHVHFWLSEFPGAYHELDSVRHAYSKAEFDEVARQLRADGFKVRRLDRHGNLVSDHRADLGSCWWMDIRWD